jgi:glutathione S-transferase
MITLYQLHWSHYVEKVRWALDYKGVDWTAVEVDPFTKREMHHLQCRTTLDTGHKAYTVPTIHDDSTGATLGESSSIIDYLERTYTTHPLYPADAEIPALPAVRNDQQSVGRWPLLTGPFSYLRLKQTCGLGRTAYKST